MFFSILLERVYPIIFVNGLRVAVRTDKGVLKKCLYTCSVSAFPASRKCSGCGSKKPKARVSGLNVFNDLKARGTHDVLIVCGDGSTGLRNAVESVFPQADVQLCVVHHIRNVTQFVSWKDRKLVNPASSTSSTDLSAPIYGSSLIESQAKNPMFSARP
jgi:transposase-like protein